MRRPLILVAAAALTLSACSSEGGDADRSPSAEESPGTATVDVGATEYSFDVPPEVAGA